jgi:hypothetical protein
MNIDQGELWRRKGYELVMRYGNEREREAAKRRLATLVRIRNQTAVWMAERQRQRLAA